MNVVQMKWFQYQYHIDFMYSMKNKKRKYGNEQSIDMFEYLFCDYEFGSLQLGS